MVNGESTNDRSTVSAMSGILISRLFGFLREITIAGVFGLSPQVDAFFAAYRIPNFFRTLLGEGSLSAAFVPVLSGALVTKDEKTAVHLTQAFLSIVLIVSGSLCLLGITFAPQIITWVAPGFSPDLHRLAAGIMRITFPFFAFLVLGAWSMGILHVRGRFFLPSVAPAFLSGAQILFLLFLGVYFAPEPIYALAWGVLVGGALQFLIQVPALFREGFSVRPVWDPRLAEIRRIGALFLPVVMALGVNQVNSLVDTFLSSFLARGSLASLGYATRLYTFPLSLFGVSIAMVALPSLSRESAGEDLLGGDHIERVREWWLKTLFLLIPSSLFLIVFSHDIVSLVYERGAFGASEVQRVGDVLLLYAIGLPAFGSVKILVSGFHSLQDTRTPMRKAIVTTLTNIVLSVVLMQFIAVRGIALATSISAGVHVTLLSISLSRRSAGRIVSKSVIGVILRILAVGLLAIAGGWWLWRLFLHDLAAGWPLVRWLRMLLLGSVVGGVYLGLARITGAGRLGRR
jgi:putative peptidoglycan lipid II flippase